MTTPSLIMIDDNSLAAAAMERRFSGASELQWLGWTSDPAAAAKLVADRRPTVVLLDVDMPGVDTFALLRTLTALNPAPAVVMFSGHDRPDLVDQALDGGAAGYIHKDEPIDTITNLLLRAAKGEYVLSPFVTRIDPSP